jgi:flagellin-like protein
MKMTNKRGLSPVIATVLLISIALILAVIIFLWARSFLAEDIQKFGQTSENLCGQVNFKAELVQQEIQLTNLGTIALYGVEARGVLNGEENKLSLLWGNEDDKKIAGGDYKTVPIDNFPTGGQIIINPVIVGENSKGERKSYTCGDDFSQTINV